jgi:preprotein translocase subunit SecD
MVSRITRFNTYLLSAVCILWLTGCQSTSKKENMHVATMRVHLEVVSEDILKKTQTAKIAQTKFTVDKESFLDESEIIDAEVIDSIGGFALVVSFDRRGSMLLEQYTAMNTGKHIAINAGWGQKPAVTRWIAAPIIKRRIGDGRLAFTPDATREEAEEIALGLNVHAKSNSDYEKKKKKDE